jgi:hypothetical protein
MLSTSQHAKASHFVLWLWKRLRVSAILTLGGRFKKVISPKYCRFSVYILASEPRISVVSAHSFADYADKDSRLAPLSTRSLSLYACISARVSPTYNLTVLNNYSQRSAFVKFPCKRFSLSTIAI